MNFEESADVSLPEQQARPFRLFVEYKGGKTPGNFAATATAEQAGAGFSAFDKETESRRLFNLPLRLIVVGQGFGVSGVTKMGDRYTGYYSNMVADTRTDIMRVFCRGINQPIATGVYKDIKPEMPQGVGFQHYLICYNPEEKELQALQVTVGLSNHIKRAIADAAAKSTGRKTRWDRVNIFDLLSLDSAFYMFTFLPEFQKVNKEGEIWATGEAYFYPAVYVATIRKPEQVAFLHQQGQLFSRWLQSDIERNQEAAMSDVKPTQPTQASQPHQPEQYASAPPPSNAKQVEVPPNPSPVQWNEDLPF